MIRHLVVATPGSRRRYRRMFADIGLPKLWIGSPAAHAAFYRANGLSR